MSKGRGILAAIWNGLFKGIANPPKTMADGVFKGKDHWGTEYYEIPANPKVGKYKPKRMFMNAKYEDEVDVEIPMEWQSWLRMRRDDPPTQEEIDRNYAIMQQKKINAAKIEAQEREKFPDYAKKLDDAKRRQQTTKLEGGDLNFPVYEEYTSDPSGAPRQMPADLKPIRRQLPTQEQIKQAKKLIQDPEEQVKLSNVKVEVPEIKHKSDKNKDNKK
ncbi:uncharacterized protein B4U80_09640 [Leptotrombidium deliense]|uniref:Mimitin-like protein n=1 Tax=Leptotrombidium deliense TaxID=299467 RepID=A0A443S7X1_9ACAR|nr:uncharacterized protein B4U80_09640 [Leptotrombidium deliense]